MRRILLALTICLIGTTAKAEEAPALSLRDLFTEMERMAEEAAPMMQRWMSWLGPQLEALGDRVEDWTLYEAPEILPNGDIIIRKKLGPPQEGELDL